VLQIPDREETRPPLCEGIDGRARTKHEMRVFIRNARGNRHRDPWCTSGRLRLCYWGCLHGIPPSRRAYSVVIEVDICVRS
jgi:hypothetical protein